MTLRIGRPIRNEGSPLVLDVQYELKGHNSYWSSNTNLSVTIRIEFSIRIVDDSVAGVSTTLMILSEVPSIIYIPIVREQIFSKF